MNELDNSRPGEAGDVIYLPNNNDGERLAKMRIGLTQD